MNGVKGCIDALFHSSCQNTHRVKGRKEAAGCINLEEQRKQCHYCDIRAPIQGKSHGVKTVTHAKLLIQTCDGYFTILI